jgi:hypothetical protein
LRFTGLRRAFAAWNASDDGSYMIKALAADGGRQKVAAEMASNNDVQPAGDDHWKL